ncbi:unnamed protein product [Pylaiella littoralis]
MSAAAVSRPMQGDVIIYQYPGLLGTLGRGLLHPRFLVLERGVLFVYASENDWADHQEPLDDVVLSPDSTVETVPEGAEFLVKLRCPGYPQLTFNGNSATLSPETDADGTSHVDSGNAGPNSWAWGEALTREIAKLRREPTIGRWRGSSGAGGGASSRRLLDAVSEAAGGEASVFVSVSSAETSGRGRGRGRGGGGGGGGFVFEKDEDSYFGVSSLSARKEEGEDDDGGGGGGGGREEKGGYGGGGGVVGGSGREIRGIPGVGGVDGSTRSAGGEKTGPAFRRWPLKRDGPNQYIPTIDSTGDQVGAASSTASQAATAAGARAAAAAAAAVAAAAAEVAAADRGIESETGGGGGPVGGARGAGGMSSLWKKVAAFVKTKDVSDCTCILCLERSSGSHSGHSHAKLDRMSSASYRHACSWVKKCHHPSSKVGPSPAGHRWEYLVGRWVPLQMARSGDVVGVKRFLEKFPAFPDKDNLLRAAVRYKQYSLVEYMLEEQGMDVNLTNSMGMPLVWFSVMFMPKGDSGVMLRYLLQKGADIHSKSHLGQTVVFMLVSSRGKEAIPMLKYLVEECGLSLSDKDNFGSRPLHWAVLHGHLDTVQWISRSTKYQAARANWAKAFEQMQQSRMVRPEHVGAARSWRMRGLRKSARSLTPLGVAVLHNHEHIAKWLMGYGGEDGACLSCKRENLFADGNRDLALVAKTWPELLPEVLQGFEHVQKALSTSWDTADKRVLTPTGWSERVYDVRLLYGIPEVPVNRSPLSILLTTDHPLVFETKVVQMVVALKWSVFGRRYYLWELGRYLFLAMSFIMGFVMWADAANWVGPLDSSDDRLAVVGGTVSRLLCWVLTLYNLFVEEGREVAASKSIKKYLVGGWNLQSVTAYVLVLALIPVFKPWQETVEWGSGPLEYTKADTVRRCLTAPAAIFLFTRLMEHLAMWKSTGIFIAVIRMVIVDTASWSILFILFEAAFALAFYALLEGNSGYETLWASTISIFVLSFGEFDLPFSENEVLNLTAVIMAVVFMLIVAIVYLNLLVAMMTNGYTEVVMMAAAQATMNRAAALVKWEGIMTDATRGKAFRKVAPDRGKRSHITLTGWFGGAPTEVFCNEEGARAIEPEQNSIFKRVDTHAVIMKELGEIRNMLGKSAARGGGHFARKAPDAGGESTVDSSDYDASFRKRQAGMLDAHGKGLSTLRLSGGGGGSRRAGGRRGGGTGGGLCGFGHHGRIAGMAREGARGPGGGELKARRCPGAGDHPRVPVSREGGAAVSASPSEPARGGGGGGGGGGGPRGAVRRVTSAAPTNSAASAATAISSSAAVAAAAATSTPAAPVPAAPAPAPASGAADDVDNKDRFSPPPPPPPTRGEEQAATALPLLP